MLVLLIRPMGLSLTKALAPLNHPQLVIRGSHGCISHPITCAGKEAASSTYGMRSWSTAGVAGSFYSPKARTPDGDGHWVCPLRYGTAETLEAAVGSRGSWDAQGAGVAPESAQGLTSSPVHAARCRAAMRSCQPTRCHVKAAIWWARKLPAISRATCHLLARGWAICTSFRI